MNAALACGFQYGAAKPGEGGHEGDTAGVATDAPSRSRSAGSDMIPISISQVTAAPTVYTWPSRQ